MKSKVSILGVKSILLVCGVLMYFTAIIIPRGFTNPAVYQNSVGTKIPATTKGTISNPLYLLFWGEPGSPPIHPGTSFDLTMVTELAPGDNERGTFWLPLNSWPGITDSTEEDIWKIEKVRRSEEQSDKLTATIPETRTVQAWTPLQDANPY